MWPSDLDSRGELLTDAVKNVDPNYYHCWKLFLMRYMLQLPYGDFPETGPTYDTDSLHSTLYISRISAKPTRSQFLIHSQAYKRCWFSNKCHCPGFILYFRCPYRSSRCSKRTHHAAQVPSISKSSGVEQQQEWLQYSNLHGQWNVHPSISLQQNSEIQKEFSGQSV